MAWIETDELPYPEELREEEMGLVSGGLPLPPVNRVRRITLQTDTGEIL